MTDNARMTLDFATCLGCGYMLDGLVEHRCPECGRPFDPTDTTTFRSERGPLSRLAIGRDMTDVNLQRQVLVDHGIRAVVMGDALAAQSGIGSPAAPPSVWVLEEDVARATEVLSSLASEETPTESWVCTACGEDSEGQFGACWSCGAPRPGAST